MPLDYRATHFGVCAKFLPNLLHVVSLNLPLSIQTKDGVCKTPVLSILYCISGAWTPFASDVKAIESYHI